MEKEDRGIQGKGRSGKIGKGRWGKQFQIKKKNEDLKNRMKEGEKMKERLRKRKRGIVGKQIKKTIHGKRED